MSVLMPTISPSRLRRGPPELPGLILASVWMYLRTRSPDSKRKWPPVAPTPLMMPAVTVWSMPSGLPTAMAHSPMRLGDEAGRRALEAHDADVGERVGAHDARRELALVGELERDLARAAHDVAVREHVARGV